MKFEVQEGQPYLAMVGQRVRATARSGSYFTGILQEVKEPRFRLTGITAYDAQGKILPIVQSTGVWLPIRLYSFALEPEE